MARNEEKAQSMLNRYLRGKAEEKGEYYPVGDKRPSNYNVYLVVLGTTTTILG
jgi:hypothetical protein